MKLSKYIFLHVKNREGINFQIKKSNCTSYYNYYSICWINSRALARTNQILDNASKNNARLKQLDEMKVIIDLGDKSTATYNKATSTYGIVIEHLNEFKDNEERPRNFKTGGHFSEVLIEDIQRESLEIMERVSTEISDF